MSRLPTVTGEQVIAALRRGGFDVVRQKGSHVFMAHPDGRKTVVPVHKGEDLGPGLISKVLADAKLGREGFRKLLRG
ncbi:MAG: type II toxin-antitoxin system HicA family toxin [Chloroflexi bacterium]|nr:type II toxin-antitoxin system HicA family toxin [Chloroflexota bacterium]